MDHRQMKCPRCVQVIHRGAENCPHCGFSISEVDLRFGSEDVRIHRLEDAAGLMRSSERQRVEAAMDVFQKTFPQLFFAVHTGVPGERGDVRQFGFWLLNHAAFEDVAVDRPNEQGILLTIDPDAKSAGITWGYGLDPYLTEKDTFLSLSRAHVYWVEGRFAEGILRAMGQLTQTLVARSRRAQLDPEYFERKVMSPSRSRKMRLLRRVGKRLIRNEVPTDS